MTNPLPFRNLASIVLTFAAILNLGCNNKSAASSVSPFPESNQVPGWTASGEIRTFSSTELWKYIDGDAEKYLKAGVVSNSNSDYKFQDKLDVVVDIYTMVNPNAAKTIFESEPTAGASMPQLADAARLYEQSLVFRKGRYLVRVVAFQSSPQLSQGLLELGRRIDEKLNK